MKSIVVSSVLSLALIGCGSISNVATETATHVLDAALSTQPDHVIALIQQQPEYRKNLTCIATGLDSRGWDSDNLEYFMKVTHNSGNYARASSAALADTNMLKLITAIEDCS